MHLSLTATMTICTSNHLSFRLFSSHPGVLTPVRGESLKINGFDVSLPIAITTGVANV